jgi:Cu(I)/Ag(I) efflux system membrane fusion protein/cobalt-zinc-cadmium efflux system membrane fusion protein
MSRQTTLLVAAAVLVIGGAGVFLALRGGAADGTAEHAAHEAAPGAAPVNAVPRVGVALDARRQQLAGVRTARAERAMMAPEIRATGTVAVDETRQTEVNTKLEGWVRDLRADYTGRPVARGEVLFTLYSPELLATTSEFLLALRGHNRNASASPQVRELSSRLVEAARERLRRLDLTADDIGQVEQTGFAIDAVTIRSPAAGVIVEKRVVEGQHVMPGEMLFRLADLSTVWVEADVPERDMALVRAGQSGAVTIETYPGETFSGRVTYIHPFVDPATRTTKVRFQLAYPRGRLRPGMFATVALAGPASSAVSVPADAVLDSGAEQIVFVAQGGGYFDPRRVRPGRRSGDTVEIVDGLQEGEEVATGATFFIDSESQLRAAAQHYAAPPDALTIAFTPQPDPPRTGDNMFQVTVKDAAGRPVTDADVVVTFFMAAMPSMNMPAMKNDARLRHTRDGVYVGAGQVMMAGRWDVTVTVSRGGTPLGTRTFALMAR